MPEEAIKWLEEVQAFSEQMGNDPANDDELRMKMFTWAIKAELTIRHLKGDE